MQAESPARVILYRNQCASQSICRQEDECSTKGNDDDDDDDDDNEDDDNDDDGDDGTYIPFISSTKFSQRRRSAWFGASLRKTKAYPRFKS